MTEYEEIIASWDRLSDLELTEVEDGACYAVFDEFIAGDVVSIDSKPVNWATLIRDRTEFEELLGASVLQAITRDFLSVRD